MRQRGYNRLVVSMVLALSAMVAGPGLAAEVIEEYTVEAARLEKPARVVIERWTTTKERAELLEVLKQNDSKLTLATLETQATTGYVQLTDTQRFDLHYAAHFKMGDDRRLILVTNRPIRLEGEIQASGAVQTGMTIIDLTIGSDGVGTGVVVVGADAVIDEATGGVRIVTAGGPPSRLGEVRRVE